MKSKYIEPKKKKTKEAAWKQERIKKYKAQEGECAICRTKISLFKRANLDHCHATSKLRGVLCRNCNLGLGFFKDDPTVLSRAIYYLYLYS